MNYGYDSEPPSRSQESLPLTDTMGWAADPERECSWAFHRQVCSCCLVRTSLFWCGNKTDLGIIYARYSEYKEVAKSCPSSHDVTWRIHHSHILLPLPTHHLQILSMRQCEWKFLQTWENRIFIIKYQDINQRQIKGLYFPTNNL